MAVVFSLMLAASSLLLSAETPTARQVVERSARGIVVVEAEGKQGRAQGSGFHVGHDGAVVTNLHVVDGADRVSVSFHDGTRVEDVMVRAFDVRRDLAVLTVELPAGLELPVLVLGDPAEVEPGASILVIGNPRGLQQTVTEGIVSAWREPQPEDARSPDKAPDARLLPPKCRMIQISAAISPGSSGGPVFNDLGEVIAVATSGLQEGTAGLNFAVPVDVVPELLARNDAIDPATLRKRADAARLELAEPHFERGEIAYERDEKREAAYQLALALRWFPRYEDALLLAGRMAMEAGDGRLAEQHLVAATEANERNAEAWGRLGALYQAMAGDDDAALTAKAEQAYLQALEIDERQVDAALGLAMIEMRRGSLERAEVRLKQAIDSDPGVAHAHYLLGEIYLGQDRLDEAEEAFNQALWEDGDHALSHYGLARLFTIVDRTPHNTVNPQGSAPEHWEEFLRLSKGDRALAEHREAAVAFVRRYFPHLLDE